MRSLKPLPEVRSLDTVIGFQGEYDRDTKAIDLWTQYVGPSRARAAMRVRESNRTKDRKSVSKTLPELLVESELRALKVKFTPQVDFGYARPDFLVDYNGHYIIIRVHGEYWHARQDARTHDDQQKAKLLETDYNGRPIERVFDLWESDVYGNPNIVARVLDEVLP